MNKKNIAQVIPIIAVSFVALLAFGAMAIDGGNFYLQRQKAQNASDQAAIASALESIKGGSWYAHGLSRAADNGYNNDGVTNTVEIHKPPVSGTYIGNDDYIQVVIEQEVEPFFLLLFYNGNLNISVTSTVHSEGTYDNFAAVIGSAIVSLGNCVSGGDHNLSFTGGGNSGGIRVLTGGIFLNSPETPGGSCALDPPNNGWGIQVISGVINSVGSYDYDGIGEIFPNPIVTNYNSGTPIIDPWLTIPEPTCSGAGTVNTSGPIDEYQPGSYSTISTGHLNPGIYCITDDVILSGSEGLTGEGVLLYLEGSLTFSGNGFMTISAPTAANCLGSAPDTGASCSYIGMVIFGARGNTGTIQTKGNAHEGLFGMVYVPDGTVESAGGGTDENDVDVTGQVVAKQILGNGNGSFTIDYQVEWTTPPPPDPPIVELAE
jgi:hypothetical protein